MGLIQIEDVAVKIHVFCAGCHHIADKLLNGIQHVGSRVAAIGLIVMGKNLKLMHVADQRVYDSGRCVQVIACDTRFRLDIDTPHTAFVLLHLRSFQ